MQRDGPGRSPGPIREIIKSLGLKGQTVDSVTVRLEWPEALASAQHGVCRYLSHAFKPSPNGSKWGASDSQVAYDIQAAMSELAVAKHFGVYWSGVAKTGAMDAYKYQVRSTTRHDGSLILYPEDKDADTFVLVINECPIFTLAGWILCKDGKQSQFYRTMTPGKPPAFFVPQDYLNPIGELK